MSRLTRGHDPSARSRWRRPLLLGLALLMALVAVSALTRDDAAFDAPLDPRNPGRDGAQAVARVLAHHGVDVEIARGQAALLEQPVDTDSVVVVTNPTELSRTTLDGLRADTRRAAALVLVGDGGLLGPLFDIEEGRVTSGTKDADCDTDLFRGLVLRTRPATGLQAPGCFGGDDSSILVQRDRLWLMTSPTSMSNEHVLEEDNGAVALRLLGQGERLVWYVADVTDAPASDGVGLASLLPPWLLPALWLVFAGTVALVLWRGRRLGPLVTEPLPVVVPAAESTHSRGQIYRHTRDRRHAAEVLVHASQRRLAEALRMPRGSPPEMLVNAVAVRTGRDPRLVAAILAVPQGGPLVGSDSQLVELSQQLIQLENEVRSS